jgi:hypothetical protein
LDDALCHAPVDPSIAGSQKILLQIVIHNKNIRRGIFEDLGPATGDLSPGGSLYKAFLE